MNVKELLAKMMEIGASDIFIIAGAPLSYKVGGEQLRLDMDPMSPDVTYAIVRQIYDIANKDMSWFNDSRNHDEDFSFAIPGVGRFRVNVIRQRGSIEAVIRAIPFELPNPTDYNIPESVMRLSDLSKGLVLVTGPAAAGKTTTLACLIDRINKTRAGHIITMEDPIEYIHSHDKSLVTQREVPTDVETFQEAMRSAMRESPDVMLLGEMRDQETIGIAMTAAEAAQLLFSTLHTTGAANTIDRIIDVFPASQQHQIRMQLSMILEAVVSQQLVEAIGGGVVPAFEIMIATPAIKNLIREGKTHQIDSVIASSADEGMVTMDQSLYDLVAAGVITKETALSHAMHQEALALRLDELR